MNSDLFLKIGDDPILDFCNTWVKHENIIEDKLDHPSRLHEFSRIFFNFNKRILDPEISLLLKLRSVLRRYFELTILNQEERALTEINKHLEQLPVTISLYENGFYLNQKETTFHSLLLTQFLKFQIKMDKTRLKKCMNPNCSHLFYDTSKNNRRAWCSMSSCGNIMKARTFYAKNRKKS